MAREQYDFDQAALEKAQAAHVTPETAAPETPATPEATPAPETTPEATATPEKSPQTSLDLQPPTGYTFNGQYYPIKYKGSMIYPKSYSELISLAQKGYGFEGANERYNKLKQQFEQEKQQWTPYQKLQEFMKSDPKFVQYIQAYGQNAQAQDTTQPNTVDITQHPKFQQLFGTVTELKEKYQTWEQKQESDNAVQGVTAKVQQMIAAHPNHDWTQKVNIMIGDEEKEVTLEKAVVAHALDMGLDPSLNNNNLEAAYRDYFWDVMQLQTKTEALTKAKEKTQANAKAGIVGKASNITPAPKPINVREKSYDDLARIAVENIQHANA